MSETEMVTVYPGSKGVVITGNENDALAKCVFLPDGRQQFFIRLSKEGLYNPWGLYTQNNMHQQIVSVKGNYKFPFVPVTEMVYTFYLAFLNTKNEVHLRAAERNLT